jgi:hypothetical protein
VKYDSSGAVRWARQSDFVAAMGIASVHGDVYVSCDLLDTLIFGADTLQGVADDIAVAGIRFIGK